MGIDEFNRVHWEEQIHLVWEQGRLLHEQKNHFELFRVYQLFEFTVVIITEQSAEDSEEWKAKISVYQEYDIS